MSRPISLDGVLDDAELPIVHPDRTIGDSVEVVPGLALGEPGPLKEIVRTRGTDTAAQLLTVTIVGSGVYESSLAGASGAPRGPLVAVVEWGIRGAKAKMEIDIPQGGVVFSLVASYVQIAARYDGLLVVNDAPLDPLAGGAPDPGPRQRVAAMVGYGSYGAASRLTRTIRLDNISEPGVPGIDPFSAPVRVPRFARRVLLLGTSLELRPYRLRIRTFGPTPETDVRIPAGAPPTPIDLPGDASFVDVENLGPGILTNPVLVFDIAV